MRSVVLFAVLSLGCVAPQSRPSTAPAPQADAIEPVALDAMLLPPVNGQLALWVNQPANFAIVGVAPQGDAYVLYQQTALDAVPASGYIYVPRSGSAPDVGYDQIYLVASSDKMDLGTRSIDDMVAQASVADAYDVHAKTVDTLDCHDPSRYVRSRPVVISNLPECHRHYEHQYQAIAANRGFFAVSGPTKPTHKSIPLPKPGTVHPKPGTRLDAGDARALRWLAAKDQWHAITHDGEPGTELVRALGYRRVDDQWVIGRANPVLATAHGEVREIVNGAVGTLHGPSSALVMEPTGRVSEVITSTWATPASDRWMAPGSHDVSAVAAIESGGSGAPWNSGAAARAYGYEANRSSGRYETSRSGSGYSSAPTSSYHEAPASHSGYSAPSAPAPSGGGGGSSSGGSHHP